MSASAYVSCKYNKMTNVTGTEELLIDIGSSSRIRVFSIFAINNYNYVANKSFGYILKEGSGGDVIYSRGITFGNNLNAGQSDPGIEPVSQPKIPDHGIECFSDLYVEGIGTHGIRALTICYQTG